MMPSPRPQETVHHLADHRRFRSVSAQEMRPRPGFHACVEIEGSRAVLRPCGEIDIAVVPDLIDLATMALTRSATQIVLMDLSDVTFIDVTGCSGLKQIYLACQEHQKHLRLQGARPQVQRVLDLVDSIIDCACEV